MAENLQIVNFHPLRMRLILVLVVCAQVTMKHHPLRVRLILVLVVCAQVTMKQHLRQRFW